jgi:integrase
MTKSHSTQPAHNRKPKRKRKSPDFPLTLHASGHWCKKVLGKLRYFGKDKDAALNLWLDQKDDLLAGREPRKKSGPGAVLMRDLTNRFMDAKDAKLRSGELSVHTWRDHDAACDELVKVFGATRAAADLHPDDFAKLRAAWAKRWSHVRVKKFIVLARGVFKFAVKNRIIPTAIEFGSEFDLPSAKTLRRERNAKGKRTFTAAELRRLIEGASQPLRAMILLGANGGMGNNDCASLTLESLDLENAWIDFPRPKTEVPRKIPLWPETVAALRAWLSIRPTPRDESFASLVFLTNTGGSFGSDDRPISRKTRALLDHLKIGGKRNFYTLRHLFETEAGESCDQVAVDFIMGHCDSSMAARYREGISDRRLRAAVDVVHRWLFAEPTEQPQLRIADEPAGTDKSAASA